uniref:F-box domain-containing protein n=1 Tax=Caenorhabditis tropicalis TaxID=1561998 RepID=A0A1I7UZV5_9PELO
MFPLLRLPFLCIQNIFDLLDIIELYNFSLISKRAKRISKRRKVNELELQLYSESPSIWIGKKDEWRRPLDFERNRFVIGRRNPPAMDPNVSPFLEALQHFMEVCRFDSVEFELRPPLTDDQLFTMIDWLNGLKTENISIRSATWPMFELFMNRFRRSIQKLSFIGQEWNGVIYKHLNFEIKQSFTSNRSDWFNLDFLFSMDTETITSYDTNLSAEDLNVFLRSWQEGKTNRNLKQVKVTTCSKVDMKKVLKGCGGEIMDPRTTKLKFRPFRFKWICGGIHIRRNDGRLAVIQNDDCSTWKKEEDVPENDIENYLKQLEMWNSEESSWYEDTFLCYIF